MSHGRRQGPQRTRRPVTDTVVASVSAALAPTTGDIGATLNLTAIARNAAGRSIPHKTYSALSSDTDVATVAAFTGHHAPVSLAGLGTANLTASCDGVDAPPISVTPTTPDVDPRILTVLEGLFTGGHAYVWDADQPRSTANAVVGGTLISTHDITAAPSSAIDHDSVSLASVIAAAVATGSGTPRFVRFAKSDDTVVADIPIGSRITIDHTPVTAGDTLTFTSCVIAVNDTVLTLHDLIQGIIDGSLVGLILNGYDGPLPRSVRNAIEGNFIADWAVTAAPTSADALTGGRSIQLAATVSPGMCYIPGTPTFIRAIYPDGTELQDIECGGPGSGKPIILSTADLVAGNVETFTDWVATVDEAIP